MQHGQLINYRINLSTFLMLIISLGTSQLAGRAVAEWLRHYATNRQVAGSIPDGVIGIFQ